MAFHSKVLLTGYDGFTGYHLSRFLSSKGYKCIGLKSDITDFYSLKEEVMSIEPDYVIHLAAISYTAEKDATLTYKVNTVGSVYLFDAIANLKKMPKKTIIASSAAVYGAQNKSLLQEDDLALPNSHYGCSKFSMENLAKNYFNKFPIMITRPFNYTGIRHDKKFLIPKLINAYRNKETSVDIGNLNVSREFNDVRDFVEMYWLLLESSSHSDIVNMCSGKLYSIKEIIKNLNNISGTKMTLNINSDYIRKNEVSSLSGCTHRLQKIIDYIPKYSLKDTLIWMYQNKTVN